MEVRRGTASRVRTSASNYTASFRVQGTITQLHGFPIFVNEGDSVVVAGKRRSGVIHGLAYWNQSKGATGHHNYVMPMIVGTLLSCASFFPLYMTLMAFNNDAAMNTKLISLVVFGGIFISGLVALKRGLAIRKAWSAVNGPF